MKKLHFCITPREANQIGLLCSQTWTDIKTPGPQIQPSMRSEPGWYDVTGLFVSNGETSYFGVEGFEFSDGSEIFRIAVAAQSDNTRVFDQDAFSEGLSSARETTSAPDLHLGKLLGHKPTIHVLQREMSLTHEMLGTNMTLQCTIDCGVLFTHGDDVLLMMVDDFPYHLRLTTVRELVLYELMGTSTMVLIR